MDTAVAAAFKQGGVADITTTGAKSGKPRRIEINFISLDDDHYLTGHPGNPRDWLANMSANPDFTLHLKQGVKVDLPVTASVVTDAEVRRAVSHQILTERLGVDPADAVTQLDRWVSDSPLVRFEV